MVELLSCPFCNGTHLKLRQDYSEDKPVRAYAWHVFCEDCHCHGRNNFPIGWVEREEDAIEAWNRRASPPPPSGSAWGVKVKPLEWHEDIEGNCYAGTIIHSAGYGIWWHWDGDHEVYRMLMPAVQPGPAEFDTLEAAKAAAQADYERRILSALTPSPSYAEGIEAAAKVAENYSFRAEHTPSAIARDIRALAGKPPAEDGWLDISTAPKDGTQFLMALKNGWVIKASAPSHPDDRYSWWRAEGVNVPIAETHREGSLTEHGMLATHWRPLPAPPNVKGGQAIV